MSDDLKQTNEELYKLIKDQDARIKKLEYDIRLLKSKHPHKSLGKGKNIEMPSQGKPMFFA